MKSSRRIIPLSTGIHKEGATLEPVLCVHHLNYAYGEELALNQVSFSLFAGGFHALLGPNGAGKSTLFSLLTRLFLPPEGAIQFGGQCLAVSSAKILASIGVVFQQPTLDLDLSVEQNLIYHGALHGLAPRVTRMRIRDDLIHFDLAHRLKEKVRNLNGGHRRRVEIVRALLHRPTLLLLDEPTVGLDLESRDYLRQRVRQLCLERGLCVLWATHLMEEVEAEDYVIILNRGQVEEMGECSTLCHQHNAEHMTNLFSQITGVA